MTKCRYFNRELSWIEFNRRVLSEALQADNPLLERLRFLRIVSSNFDEFFMVRVATLKRQKRSNRPGNSPCGRTTSQQLDEIAEQVKAVVMAQHHCLLTDILPKLAKEGISILGLADMTQEQLDSTGAIFERDVLPVLTPIKIEEARPVPFTGNLRLYAAFRLARDSARKLAIVELPTSLKRFHQLPSSSDARCFVSLDDIIVHNAKQLFPGYTVQEHAIFRVTRDADLGVDEERDEDFVVAMEEVLAGRERSIPVRLQINTAYQDLTVAMMELFKLTPDEVYHVPGLLDFTSFDEIIDLDTHQHLTYKRWPSIWPQGIDEDTDLFEKIRKGDLLLHHPYDSFEPVIKLLSDAAEDPGVLAIKMTLYRTSGNSRIIKALIRAAENGKQVAVLVEIKARFDEEQNIGWAQHLERAGAIVIYGIAELKVHSKALLIVRRELEGIRRYIHLGTGNYNEKTARLYTDMSLLSARDDLSYDVALFFNALTGYSAVHHLHKLVMAPISLKDKIITMIEREASRGTIHNRGRIWAKMNSLADPDVIEALYKASKAGVEILLNVRGICMLVPGVKGMSENIMVVSIVGRYLEHSRIFYFHNGGDEEVYLSSADWMPRNLERRAELLFPVEQDDLRQRLIESLQIYFKDTVKAHVLQSDGRYKRLAPPKGKEPVEAQNEFRLLAKREAESGRASPKRHFTVRRKPPKS